MKKRLIPILVCLLTALSFSLVGCGGDSFRKINVAGKQNTAYTVHSQGGNAVQYGNYVYFINGYAGYDDTNGDQNDWPNVVKGGLYRAELYGEQNKQNAAEFDIAKNPEAVTDGLEFVRDESVDTDGKKTDAVRVQRIAPKRIGTSGYKQGGIFIYDDYVYFASPNNEKNKSGTVQTGKTDFFRAKLDGSDAERVYTTKSATSTESAYAFYKYDGAVYLVAQDGTDLVSVRLGKKAGKKVTIAQNITSVLLPYSETYYNGMNENTLDHFVYVLRAVGEQDTQKTGNVIEIMRPDGKSGGVYHAQGKTDDTLEAVRDGLLFYRTTDNAGNTLIRYDNLHDFFMGNPEYADEDTNKTVAAGAVYGDKAYKAYQDSLAALCNTDGDGNVVYGSFRSGVTDAQQAEFFANYRTQQSGTLVSMPTSSMGNYTSTYCFRPGGENSDLVYMLGFASDSVTLYSNLKGTVDGSKILSSGATFCNLAGEYLYYTPTDGSVIYRTPWNKSTDEKGESEQVSADEVTSAGYNGDYCAGYIVYMGKADGLADGYAFFRQVARSTGSEPVFVGRKISDDTIASPKISLKKRAISWSAVTHADSYTVYYQADGAATVVAASGITETTYTVDDGKYGDYWVVAVDGTDGVTSMPSNTVTYLG